jgi:hypothetical protein
LMVSSSTPCFPRPSLCCRSIVTRARPDEMNRAGETV